MEEFIWQPMDTAPKNGDRVLLFCQLEPDIENLAQKPIERFVVGYYQDGTWKQAVNGNEYRQYYLTSDLKPMLWTDIPPL